MGKVYGYCRVSTTEQAEDGSSLDAQCQQITGYAMMKGWNVTNASAADRNMRSSFAVMTMSPLPMVSSRRRPSGRSASGTGPETPAAWRTKATARGEVRYAFSRTIEALTMHRVREPSFTSIPKYVLPTSLTPPINAAACRTAWLHAALSFGNQRPVWSSISVPFSCL